MSKLILLVKGHQHVTAKIPPSTEEREIVICNEQSHKHRLSFQADDSIQFVRSDAKVDAPPAKRIASAIGNRPQVVQSQV